MSIIVPALRPAPASSQSTPNLTKTRIRPTTVTRRSTLKRSIDDTSLPKLPSSPSKKVRVKFDTDVDIVSADEDDTLDPLLIKEQVRRSIERRLVYDNESYERIQSLFSTLPKDGGPATSKRLRYHVEALEANVMRLKKECGSLVNAVISSEWVGLDDNYVSAFVRFLGSLIVAQSGYTNAVIGMLVDLLGPQKTRRLKHGKNIRQSRIHRRVLETIRYLTQLAPLASAILAQRIGSKLDFEFREPSDRMAFVHNFMQLLHYTPEISSDILACILRQLIKLDAAIQSDLDNADDDIEDDILQHMTASQTLAYSEHRRISEISISDEDDNAGASDESDLEDTLDELDQQDLDPALKRRIQLKEDVRQVDEIMDILFEYYSKQTNSTSLETRDNALEQLITHFNSFILPTYRARHPQFLIFHFAQSDPTRVDRFVTNCISILVDQNRSPIIRHAAAAYFSGFVGRGKNVSPALVHDCFDLLCDQLDDLRQKYEPTCLGPDLKKYGDYYAMFQAVMYIFCFRWKELDVNHLSDDGESDLEDEEDQKYDLTYEIKSKLHSVMYSRLNPLRVCTPGIVEQFAKISHALGLFFIYPKIEENKRVRVATSWRSVTDLDINQSDRAMGLVGEDGMLEGYYPYDPYHLPISKHWIEGDYVEWQGIPGEPNDDSDSQSDSEAEDYDLLDDIDDGEEIDGFGRT